MMKRMLGFCGVCASAGVAAPHSDIVNIVALSSDVQDRFCEPTSVLRNALRVPGDLY